METGKRSRNFTEREKMLLIELAKDFVSIIDNKKTDGTTVEAKKQAWMALTNKFNAVSETGVRTEKQLHALYDNLKKKARTNMSDDKVGCVSLINLIALLECDLSVLTLFKSYKNITWYK